MNPVRAGDLMSREVIAVGLLEPVSRVIRLFQTKGISSLPVIDEENRLTGIITKADVIAHTLSWGAPVISDTQASGGSGLKGGRGEWSGALVRDVMSAILVTATPDTSASELARIMRERDIHHVPITVEGKLVGMVSSLDLLRLLQRDA